MEQIKLLIADDHALFWEGILNMPDLNGIEATRRILQAGPDAGIIMLTMLEDDASVFAAMRAGARGYILKGSNHNEML